MNLNQVTVSVNNVEESIKFYENLGLNLIVKSLPNYARFECPVGYSTLSIHKSENIANEQRTWIYFEIDDLDKQVNLLQEKGIAFEELPADKPWLWREARLKDPDNNLIILYFAGENRLNPPWRISNQK